MYVSFVLYFLVATLDATENQSLLSDSSIGGGNKLDDEVLMSGHDPDRHAALTSFKNQTTQKNQNLSSNIQNSTSKGCECASCHDRDNKVDSHPSDNVLKENASAFLKTKPSYDATGSNRHNYLTDPSTINSLDNTEKNQKQVEDFLVILRTTAAAQAQNVLRKSAQQMLAPISSGFKIWRSVENFTANDTDADSRSKLNTRNNIHNELVGITNSKDLNLMASYPASFLLCYADWDPTTAHLLETLNSYLRTKNAVNISSQRLPWHNGTVNQQSVAFSANYSLPVFTYNIFRDTKFRPVLGSLKGLYFMQSTERVRAFAGQNNERDLTAFLERMTIYTYKMELCDDSLKEAVSLFETIAVLYSPSKNILTLPNFDAALEEMSEKIPLFYNFTIPPNFLYGPLKENFIALTIYRKPQAFSSKPYMVEVKYWTCENAFSGFKDMNGRHITPQGLQLEVLRSFDDMLSNYPSELHVLNFQNELERTRNMGKKMIVLFQRDLSKEGTHLKKSIISSNCVESLTTIYEGPSGQPTGRKQGREKYNFYYFNELLYQNFSNRLCIAKYRQWLPEKEFANQVYNDLKNLVVSNFSTQAQELNIPRGLDHCVYVLIDPKALNYIRFVEFPQNRESGIEEFGGMKDCVPRTQPLISRARHVSQDKTRKADILHVNDMWSYLNYCSYQLIGEEILRKPNAIAYYNVGECVLSSPFQALVLLTSPSHGHSLCAQRTVDQICELKTFYDWSIKIGEYDIEYNGLFPPFKNIVRGYPEFLYVNKTHVVIYTGIDRTVRGVLHFLRTHMYDVSHIANSELSIDTLISGAISSTNTLPYHLSNVFNSPRNGEQLFLGIQHNTHHLYGNATAEII